MVILERDGPGLCICICLQRTDNLTKSFELGAFRTEDLLYCNQLFCVATERNPQFDSTLGSMNSADSLVRYALTAT